MKNVENSFTVLDCVVVLVVVFHVVTLYVTITGNTINAAINKLKPSTNANARDDDEHPRHSSFAGFS